MLFDLQYYPLSKPKLFSKLHRNCYLTFLFNFGFRQLSSSITPEELYLSIAFHKGTINTENLNVPDITSTILRNGPRILNC